VPLLRRTGYTLHYETFGSGYPLFLLPGAAGDGMTWWSAGYVDELMSDFACVLVDPPGMGASGTPHRVDAYAVDAIAGDMLALADALGFDRFAVWGQSAGAALGFVLAATQPGRVAALVASGSWPAEDEVAARPVARALAEAFRTEGSRALLMQAAEGEGFEWPEWGVDLDPNREVVARIIDGFASYAWEEHARPERITVPTLIIAGELEDPDGTAQTAARAMPNAEAITLLGFGHVGGWILAVTESIAVARPFLQRTILA
jgi:pimeloyl-ACP methyl ester carboxylesterase